MKLKYFFIDKIKTKELFNSNNLIEEYEILKISYVIRDRNS